MLRPLTILATSSLGSLGWLGALAVSPALPAQQALAVFDAPVIGFDAFFAAHELGDLDGDGDLDALGFWYRRSDFREYRIRSFLNNGDGSFRPGFDFLQNRVGGSNFGWEMRVGRFDADARDDWVSWFQGTVRVYTSGPGGVPTEIATWQEGFAGGSRIVVHDWNGDGLDDLAFGATPMNLYLNTGGGAFQLASSYPRGGVVWSAEMNGDGVLDLLVPFGNLFEVLYVDRDGQVTAPGIRLWHGMRLESGDIVHVTPGDVDGDGDEDIVMFKEADAPEYAVFRRTGPATFVAEPPVAGGPASDLADIDGDGDLDGLCCGGGGDGIYPNGYESHFRIAPNDGTGAFAIGWEIPSVGAQRLAGAADIDGDGDRDLVAGRSVYFNRDSFGRDPQPKVITGLNQPLPRFGGDLDGDGDPDLNPGLRQTWRNDGQGGYALHDPALLVPPPLGTIWTGPGWPGDFDGDGDTDLVVGFFDNTGFAGMRRFVNAGNGELVDGGYAARGHNFNESGYLYSFGPRGVTADIDGDGDLDLVPYGNPTGVWLNDGSGAFQRGPLFSIGVPIDGADLDGDGNLDLIATYADSLHIAFGDGAGTFGGTANDLLTFANRFNPAVDRLAIADVGADQDLDVVVIDRTSTSSTMWAYVLENQGARQFARNRLAQVPIHGSGGNPRQVHAGDVDGDGALDLVLRPVRYAWTASWILRGDGQGGFRAPVVQPLAAAVLADADGDGDLDAIEERVVRGARYGAGASAGGGRFQYGDSGVGAGGFRPVLGATGPFRAGETVTWRVRGVPGRTLINLVFGFGGGPLANWPFPGMTSYSFPLLLVVTLPTQGPAAPGEGRVDASLTVPPDVYGFSLFQQLHVVDPAEQNGLGLNWSHGLRLDIGR